jgi:hypothetical protein
MTSVFTALGLPVFDAGKAVSAKDFSTVLANSGNIQFYQK